MRILPHAHDYEMEFRGEHSLEFELRCRCGDTCHTTAEALSRTRVSGGRCAVVVSLWLVGAAALSWLALALSTGWLVWPALGLAAAGLLTSIQARR